MQRNRNIAYDDDDLYDDADDDYSADPEYTDEDLSNFATLTPVVRAELDEAGLQASNREIEDALWESYWDVGSCVVYFKNKKGEKKDGKVKQQGRKKEKPKSRFDEAAEKNVGAVGGDSGDILPAPPTSAGDWFAGISWSGVESSIRGHLVCHSSIPRPRLLGGSSKLAKLAEERRRKATAATNPSQEPNGVSNSLDRLGKTKGDKENATPQTRPETKKYPVRRKKELTPPPKEPSPEPEEVVEEELPNLKASPTSFGRALSTGDQAAEKCKPAVPNFLGAQADADPFKGPSPDDVILRAQKQSKLAGSTKPKQATNGLAKKTEALKIDSTSAAPPQPKIKSKGLDVPKLWEEEKSKRKPSAAFVVIGHVDHGKSTLMGRLLLDTGAVSQRDIDKYKKQATELGKASFALAWVMDTGSEERERGVTVDIAQHHFSTSTADFTILDAPGHRDFVPNMIGGASMADVAVLVVDANQLESGMKGQTREHVLLANACGLGRVVVAVNKMDSTAPEAWSRDVFEQVSGEVVEFLTKTGFAREDVQVVPCSGLGGDNVAKAAQKARDTVWIANDHPTLLQALERAASTSATEESIKAPLAMQITDVFRGGVQNPLSVSGRISTGNVQVGDAAIVQPSGESAAIKGIEVAGEGRDWAVAGEMCTLHLTDIDAQHLRSGDMLCSATKPVPVVKSLQARVQALESLLPQGVDVHFGRLHVPGSVAQLVQTVDAKGEVLRRKPRVVKEGQLAVVKVVLEEGAPVVAGARIVLRANGATVAAGTVE